MDEELYDLRKDPKERTDLCSKEPLRCRSFAARLQAWMKGVDQTRKRLKLPSAMPAVIDQKTRERLCALGYE